MASTASPQRDNPCPSDEDVAGVAADAVRRVERRRGDWRPSRAQRRFEEDAPFLAALTESSVAGVVATGPRRGRRIVRVRGHSRDGDGYREADLVGRLCAEVDGFNLQAATRIRVHAPGLSTREDASTSWSSRAHSLICCPLCELVDKHPRELLAFPGARVTVFPPVLQTFWSQPLPEGQSVQEQLPLISVDLPDVRAEIVCRQGKLIALRQARYDVTAARPGYERVARSISIH